MLDTVSSVFESTLKTKRLWIPTFVGMTDKKKALKDFKAYSYRLIANGLKLMFTVPKSNFGKNKKNGLGNFPSRFVLPFVSYISRFCAV